MLLLFASAGPAFGQTVSFVDGEGNPATIYLEGSRAYLRVEDPAANMDGSNVEAVLADISAALSGDFEQVFLYETGPATGVFGGSIALALGGRCAEGRTHNPRDRGESPAPFAC